MIHDAHGWWLGQEAAVEPAPALAGERAVDVAIVGGGFAGMWTAWLVREAQPDARVILLESGLCGHGPSGRNGGFVNAMWFSLPTLRRRFGDVAAIDIARAAQRAVDEIGTWCESQEVDAWFRPSGYLQVATTPAHDGAWLEAVKACAELGAADAVRALGRDEVRARCASPIFRAGALFPGAATVNPARLALGLRDRLLAAGVEIHERSKVLGLAESRGEVEIRTRGGRVRAGRAVLAMGAALEAVPPLRRRLTLTSSHMVITEPVPELLEEMGWTGGECVTDSRHMLHYFRTTRDGRIAFGWGGGRVVPGARPHGKAELDPALIVQVIGDLRRFFPALAGRRVDHAWGGPIDVSPSHTPIVGSLGDRVHFAFGFTGHGVGPSRMVAHALCSLALDRRDDHARLAIVDPPPLKVPPEPFRYAGGAVIRQALLRREAAEEEGRQAGALTRLLAGLPERLGVQVGR